MGAASWSICDAGSSFEHLFTAYLPVLNCLCCCLGIPHGVLGMPGFRYNLFACKDLDLDLISRDGYHGGTKRVVQKDTQYNV